MNEDRFVEQLIQESLKHTEEAHRWQREESEHRESMAAFEEYQAYRRMEEEEQYREYGDILEERAQIKECWKEREYPSRILSVKRDWELGRSLEGYPRAY